MFGFNGQKGERFSRNLSWTGMYHYSDQVVVCMWMLHDTIVLMH